MVIKAVILDFGGTLSDGALDWDPYHEMIRAILAGRGQLVEMSRLKKALREALGDLNRVRAKGKEMTFGRARGVIFELIMGIGVQTCLPPRARSLLIHFCVLFIS